MLTVKHWPCLKPEVTARDKGRCIYGFYTDVCIPHPTVLVFIEELGRGRSGVPCFASHFVPEFATHGDVDELVPDAFAFQDPDDLRLLRLDLGKKTQASVRSPARQHHLAPTHLQ